MHAAFQLEVALSQLEQTVKIARKLHLRFNLNLKGSRTTASHGDDISANLKVGSIAKRGRSSTGVTLIETSESLNEKKYKTTACPGLLLNATHCLSIMVSSELELRVHEQILQSPRASALASRGLRVIRAALTSARRGVACIDRRMHVALLPRPGA
jgi:hypothetical protein